MKNQNLKLLLIVLYGKKIAHNYMKMYEKGAVCIYIIAGQVSKHLKHGLKGRYSLLLYVCNILNKSY